MLNRNRLIAHAAKRRNETTGNASRRWKLILHALCYSATLLDIKRMLRGRQ